jgi:hypothetical protein
MIHEIDLPVDKKCKTDVAVIGDVKSLSCFASYDRKEITYGLAQRIQGKNTKLNYKKSLMKVSTKWKEISMGETIEIKQTLKGMLFWFQMSTPNVYL